jgi:hypothetical protein
LIAPTSLHGNSGIGGNHGSGSLTVEKTINLSWNALPATKNALTNPVGYKVHLGLFSKVYTITQDVGAHTSANIAGLETGKTYFIVVTAYNAAGKDGAYSNEIRVIAP